MSMRTLVTAAFFGLASMAIGCSSSPAASVPAPSSGAAATTINVVLTPSGCTPTPATAPAGAITFNVTNTGADAVSELELKQGEQTVAEKENLTPGLSGTFTATLAAGSYVLECPGATTDETAFTVTAN